MNYLTGYTIKPYATTSTGEVRFTDGTNNDIRANQVQCQAYGYTYDPVAGTCNAFTPTKRLARNESNIDNKINGPRNTTELGSTLIQINGTNNTAKGMNRNCLINGSDNTNEGSNNNCFISGSDNTIASGVSNATVVGSNGTALNDGEFLVGSTVGQKSQFFMNINTTDGTETPLKVNDTIQRIMGRNTDSVYYYTIDVYAYRTGGTSGSGSAGDRAFYTLRGMVQDFTYDEVLTTNVTRGTSGDWIVATDYATVGLIHNMYLVVTGLPDQNIRWEATVNFYQMKL
jgi:hypothetical protein